MTIAKRVMKLLGQRSHRITELLQDVPVLTFNPTYGAFYNTIIF